MTVTSPSACWTHDCADSLATDGSQVTDILNADPNIDDDNTATTVTTQGGDPDDIIRVDYAVDPTGLSTSDTFTVYFNMTMNYTVMRIAPYSDGSGNVDATNALTYTMSGGSPATFTLTQAFIDDLFDQGSGSFAIRITEDTTAIAGTVQVAEIDADLTLGALSPGAYLERMEHMPAPNPLLRR